MFLKLNNKVPGYMPFYLHWTWGGTQDVWLPSCHQVLLYQFYEGVAVFMGIKVQLRLKH